MRLPSGFNQSYTARTSTPAPDYLLSQNGHAWVVFKDGDKAPVASDAFVSFVAKTNAKYARAPKDAKTQKQIDDEFGAFKKSDNGMVSAARLQRLSRAMGLRILDKPLRVAVPCIPCAKGCMQYCNQTPDTH
jgi:hypothetical protein